MRNRLTHGLGGRGHWLDMLGGSAGKVNEAPGLPWVASTQDDCGRKIAMTPTMMDYGARAGIGCAARPKFVSWKTAASEPWDLLGISKTEGKRRHREKT